MIIPGFLVSIVTFPGVIVHEMAHQYMCRLFRLPVYDVCYFRFGNPCGYVFHEPAQSYEQSFWICVGPLIFNTLAAMVIGFPAAIGIMTLGIHTPMLYFLGWLAVSIGMHAFPSTGDARGLWASSKAARVTGNGFAMLGLPFVVLIYAANIASILWFDAIYAIAVAGYLPNLIVRTLAGA